MLFKAYFVAALSFFAMSAPAVALPLERRGTVKGVGTWYDAGLGACGETNNNKQMIIALSHLRWKKKLCGKWITVTDTDTRRKVKGVVKDMCPGCAKNNLDLSKGMFKKLDKLGKGVIPIKWKVPSAKRSVDEDDDSDIVDVTPEDQYFDPAMELTAADLEDDDDDTPESTTFTVAPTPTDASQ
ncbi:hypothetical protein FRB99_005502 [Tulasnella sp. 403]|nr:hypothetical protein FRB99_005502 [Tulasnella sp. 403]